MTLFYPNTFLTPLIVLCYLITSIFNTKNLILSVVRIKAKIKIYVIYTENNLDSTNKELWSPFYFLVLFVKIAITHRSFESTRNS